MQSHASCHYRRASDSLAVGTFGSQAVVNFEGSAATLSPHLLWLLMSVFPGALMNVLFPTTHASGIDSELF